MKILTDYHHGNLYYSLHLLFEKRLGHELYRPIGTDWLTRGWWKVAEPYGNNPDTVKQYLGIDDRHWDAHKNLNGNYKLKDDIYHIYDLENKISHKAITFDTFRGMKFDLIIGTHPLHNNWVNLRQYHQKSKFIMQIGNENQVSDARNILCSTLDFKPTPDQHFIRYHQEINLDDCKYVPPKNHNKVKSFVVALPDPGVYEMLKAKLPEFEFRAYGVGSPDGTVSGYKIPKMMQDSAFGYHVKPLDGFGVVIHKWALSGRPLIVKGSYYTGKLAEPLLIDGVTCIDLDKHTLEESVRMIRESAKPENHRKMCRAMYENAKKIIDYDREAREVKKWLDKII